MRLLVFFQLFFITSFAQQKDSIFSFWTKDSVRITIDQPANFSKKNTIIVLYALPNGNTTEQTMGKKISYQEFKTPDNLQTPDNDWHFDIQHIRAQTRFIRNKLKDENFVVVYLENNLKAWPAWKQRHADHLLLIQQLVDTIYQMIPGNKKQIYLNGHSGGGSFIFGFMAGVKEIPAVVQRISFIDSNYGYDSSYLPKIRSWLKQNRNAHLIVFAYNDSIALYNGKPVVSATGGTWYRSHKMMNDLSADFSFKKISEDSIVAFRSTNRQVGFFYKDNPNRGIYHTQQVELNGFIHSIFFGTKNESKGYIYYGPRAYSDLIEH